MCETHRLNLYPDTLHYELMDWNEPDELCFEAEKVVALMDYGLNKRGLCLRELHDVLGVARMGDLSGLPPNPFNDQEELGSIDLDTCMAQIDQAAKGHYWQGVLL